MACSPGEATTFGNLIAEGALEIGDGYRARNEELGGDGLMFLRAGHVTDTHIDFDGVERFRAALESRVRSKLAKSGDAVVTTKGNSTGRTTFVSPSMPPFVYSPHLSYWRSLDSSRIEGGFLRYWARGSEFADQLGGMKASTDMAPYLSLVDQRRLRITLPPIAEQRAIAHILGALDDKIDLNRRMSETLEAMARALFKSWFVDFDPIRAEAEGRDPDARPTEEVPFEAVISFKEGPGIMASDFRSEGVPLIRLAGLEAGSSLLDGCNYLDPATVRRRWDHFRLAVGDTLLSTSASLGRVAVVTREAEGAIPYTGLIRMRPRNERLLPAMIPFVLGSEHFQNQVEAVGAGSVLRHFGPTHLRQMTVRIGPIDRQQTFVRRMEPVLSRIQSSREQSSTLAALRDTLLPKLISGELRIPDAKRMVEKAV